MKLNLGCGSQIAQDWVNVDYALGAKLSKIPLFKPINRRLRLFQMDWDDKIFIHDLTKRFPWEDDSVDVVYSSHTLEHFSKSDGKKFLQECHRVLRKGGIIRILVPDLKEVVNGYSQNQFSADEFVERLLVLYEEKSTRLKTVLSLFVQHPHKCMYDTSALLRLLDELGFDAQSKGLYESAIDDIRSIELENRVKGAVVVEGVKR